MDKSDVNEQIQLVRDELNNVSEATGQNFTLSANDKNFDIVYNNTHVIFTGSLAQVVNFVSGIGIGILCSTKKGVIALNFLLETLSDNTDGKTVH